MRKSSVIFRAILLLMLPLPCQAAADDSGGTVHEVAPGEDYTETLRHLMPGDELVFLPGIHEGHAVLTASGDSERPITISGRRQDGEIPELRFTGRGNNLWRIRASHLVIRDIAFHATHAYGIRIERADNITIDQCLFRDCGGGDLSANSADVDGLNIRNCRFIGSRSTPVYIGNHQGSLAITNFVFERNVIDGSKIQNGVGYGIQLKLNVSGGRIRENFITGTQGPGIMVYGSANADPDDAQRVERNIVVGSRNNPGIVVGGGPATVQGNIVLGCHSGGISVMDYGGRDILDGVQLLDNVVALNGSSDLSVSGAARGLIARGNRAWTHAESGGFRGMPEGEQHDNQLGKAGEPLRKLVADLTDKIPQTGQLIHAWQRLAEPIQTQQPLVDLFAPDH